MAAGGSSRSAPWRRRCVCRSSNDLQRIVRRDDNDEPHGTVSNGRTEKSFLRYTRCPVGAVGFLGLLAASGAHASDLAVLAGVLHASADDPTYTWEAEYRQALTEHLVASLAWLNEGHLFNHHRDGQALQLWWTSQRDGPGLVLEAGLGAYSAYDTTWPPGAAGPRDEHALGAMASVAVDWNFRNRWFGSLQV